MTYRFAALVLASVVCWPVAASAESASATGVTALTSAANPAAEHQADAELVRAIREKRVIRFHYNGLLRVGEPHAYGVAATGEPLLLVYQTSGDSATQPPPGWRRFTVSLLRDLVVTDKLFAGARPGYSTEDPKLSPSWAALPAE